MGDGEGFGVIRYKRAGLADDFAVLHLQNLVNIAVHQRVMRAHEQGDLFLFDNLAKQAEHLT